MPSVPDTMLNIQSTFFNIVRLALLSAFFAWENRDLQSFSNLLKVI